MTAKATGFQPLQTHTAKTLAYKGSQANSETLKNPQPVESESILDTKTRQIFAAAQQ
ncbi:hypothetical protein [Paraburkholderia ribeironis]|uniref:hypothetical protein n=1 Tax=Paraburkholderia ribeironis TaxID=1247936 RepID=UPI00135639C2|nr:hypothetical protein [Paraburkholderia ribeironis]